MLYEGYGQFNVIRPFDMTTMKIPVKATELGGCYLPLKELRSTGHRNNSFKFPSKE